MHRVSKTQPIPQLRNNEARSSVRRRRRQEAALARYGCVLVGMGRAGLARLPAKVEQQIRHLLLARGVSEHLLHPFADLLMCVARIGDDQRDHRILA